MVHSIWSFVRTIWPFAKTISGAIAAVLTFGYMGTKAVIEFINWYREKYWDRKVEDFVESHIIKIGHIESGRVRLQTATAKTVSEISEATRLSQKRVEECLRRLKKRRIVIMERPGVWKADIPPQGSI
jgi:hypothetical protein